MLQGKSITCPTLHTCRKPCPKLRFFFFFFFFWGGVFFEFVVCSYVYLSSFACVLVCFVLCVFAVVAVVGDATVGVVNTVTAVLWLLFWM